VVVGAGFAGLTLARSLKRTTVDVILVDRRNDHLFHPPPLRGFIGGVL
jgi:NADH dehydrogenase